MNRAQRVSPNAVQALKEALKAAFWFKSDLRSYLSAAVSDRSLLAGVNWDDYKWSIIDEVIDRMVAQPARYQDELVLLMVDVASMREFPKLARHEESARLIKEANEAVAQLKEVVEPHEKALMEQEKAKLRIAKAKDEADARRAFDDQLGAAKARYLALVQASDTAARGYELEALLRDVFELFDLDPRASFRIEGEQLDGAFSLDGTNFLLEAKWQAAATARSELDAFAAKISAKIENTLGLFISINGFEPTAVTKHSGKGSVMVLMDGADLYAVLDARIDLVELLRRKLRHAAHSGEILFTAANMLGT